MEREKQNNRNAARGRVRVRRPAKPGRNDDDGTPTEVGEELDFSIFDELEPDDRRRDPLRLH